MFGKNVAKIVDGLTKISKLSKDKRVSVQAENFKKMLISPPRCDQDANLVSQFQDYLVRGTFTDISASILQKNLNRYFCCTSSRFSD